MAASPNELREALWTFLDMMASIPVQLRRAALRELGFTLTRDDRVPPKCRYVRMMR
jgi:hypothetical protein